MFPSNAVEEQIHEDVRAGTPNGTIDLYQSYMDPMLDALRRDFPSARDDDLYDSVIDAILEYTEDFNQYDRVKGRLCTFLLCKAKARLVDRLRSNSARARREESFATLVELQSDTSTEVMETVIDARYFASLISDQITNQQDRDFLRLIISGERETEVLASAFCLEHLPLEEKRREVKRNRDRLLKYLKRLDQGSQP